jgi:ABC-type polysaccharide/polyol phosphate transport system ATPase subunit
MITALEFRKVTKNYRHRDMTPAAASWRDRLGKWFKKSPTFTALDDVSFAVDTGEALGIIGHNGAGKTTTLKLLSRITAPTAGEILIRGTLSPLIELSSGFHPELTGRENIYLNGAQFGMTRKEIGQKLQSIVEFSEIGRFLDVPVKRYSSGMHLRLAFAIAAHLEPDSLLLDEVLAVGDFAFQRKCLARIDELKQAKKTIVFISHDLAAVERLCDRVLLLSHGRILREGRPREVILEYQQCSLTASAPPNFAGQLSRTVECTAFSYTSTSRNGSKNVQTGDGMTVTVEFFAKQAVSGLVINVYVYWPSGYLCTHLSTGAEGFTAEKGPGHVEFDCPVVNLVPGFFLVDVAIERTPEILDWRYRCGYLRVDPGDKAAIGDIYLPHSWSSRSGGNGSSATRREDDHHPVNLPQ